MRTRFDTGHWPPIPPLPVYQAVDPLRETGGRLLPPEWVTTELCDTNLNDDRALRSLLHERGDIDQPYFHPERVPAEARVKLSVTSTPIDASPLIADQRIAWWQGRDDGTLEDRRWWLKTVRAITLCWAHGHNDPQAIWRAQGFSTNLTTHRWFDEGLNIGLWAVSPRVQHPAAERQLVSLYTAACIQVFNFIAAGQHARWCEGCGQLIPTTHHLRRFCDESCASATKQRRYRQRKRAALGGDTAGEIRTPTPLRAADFESAMSTVPSPRRAGQV